MAKFLPTGNLQKTLKKPHHNTHGGEQIAQQVIVSRLNGNPV
jgi:hypothetical protein